MEYSFHTDKESADRRRGELAAENGRIVAGP
jgi:hypothetical protein